HFPGRRGGTESEHAARATNPQAEGETTGLQAAGILDLIGDQQIRIRCGLDQALVGQLLADGGADAATIERGGLLSGRQKGKALSIGKTRRGVIVITDGRGTARQEKKETQ